MEFFWRDICRGFTLIKVGCAKKVMVALYARKLGASASNVALNARKGVASAPIIALYALKGVASAPNDIL